MNAVKKKGDERERLLFHEKLESCRSCWIEFLQITISLWQPKSYQNHQSQQSYQSYQSHHCHQSHYCYQSQSGQSLKSPVVTTVIKVVNFQNHQKNSKIFLFLYILFKKVVPVIFESQLEFLSSKRMALKIQTSKLVGV